MKFGATTLVLAITLMLAIGCKKKPTETSNDCLAKMDFTKITITDQNAITYSIDSTDWKNDASWCDIEYALFNTSNLNLAGSDTSKLFTILYPNPLRDVGMMVLIRKQLCPIQCVVVNRSFQVLDTFSILNINGTVLKGLNFSDTLKYKHGQYYRIYYAAHCSSQLFFYKGHGDFKIE